MSLLLVFALSETGISNFLPSLQKSYRVTVLEKGDPVNTLVSNEFPQQLLYFSSFSEDWEHDLSTLKAFYPGIPLTFVFEGEQSRSRLTEQLEATVDVLLKKIPPVSSLLEILASNLRRHKQTKPVALKAKVIDFEKNTLSPKAQRIVRIAKKVAPTDATILLTGESGTGKEVLAQWIHENSSRKNKPFIAINCGAITESILESELFGHKKGSFTGADNDKAGLFEAAHNGTIFLDEIGEMPFSLQVKLLRVLQEKKVRRVGDIETFPVDVRIIAATNRDLEKQVAEGNFRQDLYYRIKVVALHLPPLRDRKEDLNQMIDDFCLEFASKYHKSLKIAPSTLNILMNYIYPGNIRELQNIMEFAVIMCESDTIQPQDLPVELQRGAPLNLLPAPLNMQESEFNSLHEFLAAFYKQPSPTLTQVEKILIIERLKMFPDNQKKVADSLGISRTSLWRKIKEYQLDTQS
jgi:transcriptional regulator with PAS, ATPase and Fis domain